jgi:branched-chain amino acid transport system permease protein
MATRENPNRVNFLGVNVRHFQWLTFTLSAFFMGVGGALFASFNSSVFPQFAYWSKSGEFLIVVLLGGMYSFIGPIVGGMVFVFLDKLITTYTVYWPLILGIILILCTIGFRSGIVGFVSDKLLKQADKGDK